MSKWAYRFSCGNPRIAAIVFGSFSIIQFSIEILFFICFAVYAATPISIVTKVFYAIAAVFSPFLLAISVLFVYNISKKESKWMRLWLFSHFIITFAELIFTVIAFILINDLNEIFQFFNDAWSLAMYQSNNQLLMETMNGTSIMCTPVPSSLFSSSENAVEIAAMISQQGAAGLIAFFVLGVISKNIQNVIAFVVGLTAYEELRDESGYPRNSQKTSSYNNPRARVRFYPRLPTIRSVT